jgi:AraC-like DNA-binding protein
MLIFCVIPFSFFNNCSKQIVPIESRFKISCYTDATGDKGNSTIGCIENGDIKFNYTLKPGFSFPYAGVSIFPNSGLLDLHRCKYLDIMLSADTVCAVNIYLKTVQDSFTALDNYLTYRFLEQTVWVNSKPRVYRIDLSTLKTPDWWYKLHKVEYFQLGKPDLKKVKNFDVATSSIYMQRPGFIHIHRLTMIGNYHPLLIGAIFCLLIISLIIYRLVHIKRKKPAEQKIISYQKQDNKTIHSSDKDRILQYIGQHYSDSDLSLEMIGRQTGVHWARVSLIIKKEHGFTYKQYLNMIRIEEAKRLLIETERQVLDIALSTGYGNVSHFNRIFKESVKCSPREFRKEKNLRI